MMLRRLGAVALVALAAVPFTLVAACSDDDPAASGPVDGAPTSTGTAPGPDPMPDAGDETDGSSDANVEAGPKRVAITFAAKVGSTPWSCGATFPSLGSTSTTVAPLDFRFFVHDVRLIRTDDVEVPVSLTIDDKWQTSTVTLLDFEDGTGTCSDGNADTNAVVKGAVPAGSYKGLAFKVGVPFTENHGNPATAASPLNVMQMSWSWLSGYRFMKIDTQPLGDGGAALPKFNLHIGSTDCTGDPANGVAVSECARPNRFEVRFSTFDVATNKVVLDYAAIVAGSDLTKNGGGPPGCMSGASDPECAPVFPELGLDLTTGAPSGTQGIFKVE